MRKFLLLIALIISGVGFVDAQNVAKIGEVSYETLPAAIEAANDGETIYLIGDASGAGSVIDKSITIDLGSYTYSFTEGVGSGNLTSNGFQILQGNTVVLTNGALNVAEDYKSNFYILVQNYANLTLNDINLDGTNLDKYSLTDQDSYVLSNNSGEVNIVGNTNITANDEGDKAYAFDVCKFASYDAPTVNVNTTGTINGNIEVSEGYDNNLRISAGAFTMDVTQWCVEGFVCEQNEDGSYGVSEIQNGDNIIIDYEGYSLKYTVTDVDAKSCSVTCSMKPTQPTDIAIPSSVEIGKIEFSVTSIDPQAFKECSNLTGIEIPNSVTSIGFLAFNGCSSLTSITIPNSVTSIGHPVLSNCPSLISINVEDGNPIYDSRDNCNAIIETATNTLMSGCQSTSILSTVVSIGSYAFQGCTFITSMYIPSSVTSIGSYAFEGCTSFTIIDVPSSVTSIGSSAYSGCSSITSIRIPNSVTYIGSSAFSDCSSLTSINIPSGITSIGSYTFKGCSSLASIEIPSTVASIGDYCFEGCSNLMRLYCYAENAPETSSTAFKDCPSDMTIYVPTVANYNTSPWSNYDKVTLPSINTITIIYYNDGDYSLTFKVIEGYQCEVSCGKRPTVPTSITIPASVEINGVEFNVTIIGSFYRCSNLTSIEIPNTVTSIGNRVLDECPSIKSIRCLAENVPSTAGVVSYYFPSDMQIQVPENSIELYKSTSPWSTYTITKIYPYHYGENVVKEYEGYSLRFTTNPVYEGATVKCEVKPTTPTVITIPSTVEINEMEFNVTAIEKSAFSQCSNLTSIEFEENSKLTSICDGAFYQCSKLTSIEIPSSVKELIGCNNHYYSNYGCFESCSNLASVVFGDNSQLTSIGDYAFSSCSKLTSIEIPSTVTSIGDYAFSSCSNLERLMFAKESRLNTIDDHAFNSCSSLTSVTIPNTVTSIGNYAFSSCSNILKFAFEENSQLNSIGNSAFNSCSKLTSIEVPNTVTTIGSGAFQSCHGLTSMNFGDNTQLTSIGSNAFHYCSNLTSIDFGDNSQLTSIGSNAFNSCSKLTSIDFGENSKLASIGDKAFYGAFSSSAVIEIPSSVTSIDNFAFQQSYLSGISFGENSQLTSISNSAFKGCSYLTNIVIPKNVTEIRNFAFQGCSKLQTVTFEEGSQMKSISDLAFKDCTLLQMVEIPSNVNYVGFESFANCKNLTMIENYAVEVPQTDSDAFKSCPERMRIQVPAESLEAYQAETPWNKFTLVTEIVQHEIAASPSINNAGTIQGTGTYFLNENVTLTAKASSSKYKFAYWSEDAEFVSDKAEYKFVVESDRNLVANFMNDNYWKPNTGISAHNMTVTADVQIEGVSANDINIEIGAFCGNELRGNARIQYFKAVDKFLYQIVIYGVDNDEITFKLYDHNTKQVLDYLTQANLTFTEDATHGSIDEPMAINFTQKPIFEITVTCNIEDACSVTGGGLYSEGEQATITANQVEGLLFQNWTLNGEVVSTNRSYTFVVTEAQEYVANYVYAHTRHLNKGWNWYSTYMQLSGEEGLNTVQTALGNAVSLMKSQTAFDSYEQGEWIGDLEDYSTEKMYMMNVVKNNGYDLTIIGTPVNPSAYAIELAPNWNWIGYPVSTDMSINDALSGITPKHGDYVKSQEHFSQYYEGSGWLGELQTLEKGKGYMYQNTSTETIELVYPNEVSRSEVKANYSNENNHWIAEIGKYPTNMNIIAVVKDADADFEIGAFCDGECRGSARPIYIEQLDTYMIFLTVYGEEGETITFRYYDVVSEDVYSVTNEVGYAVDATLGTIDEPYVLSFATTSINENDIDMINIYPNPVNVNSEIYLETECDNVEVYNALGVKIAEYENVSLIDGIETSGIYMIKIIEQGNVKFSRLVVK